MKFLILLIAFIAPMAALAQSTTPEIERAYYEVNVNGESAFYTDIHCTSMLFSKTQYLDLKENVMQKEGVFDVTYLDNGKTIRFAHLSFVEAETLKAFGNSLCDGIKIDPRSAYTF